MGSFRFPAAHYLVAVVALALFCLLSGCTTISGPCRLELTAVAEGVGGGAMQCEQGGKVIVWAPSRLVRTMGVALGQALTASAPASPLSKSHPRPHK